MSCYSFCWGFNERSNKDFVSISMTLFSPKALLFLAYSLGYVCHRVITEMPVKHLE